ncbi:MAG: hypothetical protein AB7G39_12355 [Alphaproteobacteria bacterium]
MAGMRAKSDPAAICALCVDLRATGSTLDARAAQALEDLLWDYRGCYGNMVAYMKRLTGEDDELP